MKELSYWDRVKKVAVEGANFVKREKEAYRIFCDGVDWDSESNIALLDSYNELKKCGDAYGIKNGGEFIIKLFEEIYREITEAKAIKSALKRGYVVHRVCHKWLKKMRELRYYGHFHRNDDPSAKPEENDLDSIVFILRYGLKRYKTRKNNTLAT